MTAKMWPRTGTAAAATEMETRKTTQIEVRKRCDSWLM